MLTALKTDRFYYRLGIGFLIFLYGLKAVTGGAAFVLQKEYLAMCVPDVLSVSALFVFCVLLALSGWKKKLYLLFLPGILFAYPNVVNNLFPSFYLGDLGEKGVAPFSVVSHIDLYVLYGMALFRKAWKRKVSLHPWIKVYLLMIVSYFPLSLFFSVRSLHDLALFSSGDYLMRYSVLLILLVAVLRFSTSVQKQLLCGLGLSVLFLFIESYVFTHLTGAQRLGSGTLGVNVYANIVGSILLLFVFLDASFRLHPVFRYGVIAFGLVIVLLTKTKMALLAFAVCSIAILLIDVYRRGWRKNLSTILLVTGMMSVAAGYALKEERYVKAVESISSSGIEKNRATNSIYTRILLFKTSQHMIAAHPWLGVGPGRWNYMKNRYGFPLSVMIDPHNEYLAYWSVFGIVLGTYMIWLFLLLPAYWFLRSRWREKEHTKYFFGIIPLMLLFAGLTNANMMKQQVAALIMLLVFAILKRERNHA